MHYPVMRCPKSPKRSRHVLLPRSITSPSKYSRKVSIGRLSDEVLLNVFCHYMDQDMDASPRFWLRLVQICHKWRRIVFASQRALHLRLY
ncbi:hypothetical protein EDB83DRAFT_2555265, partial [Lactarius deliciosus]